MRFGNLHVNIDVSGEYRLLMNHNHGDSPDEGVV